MTEQIRTFIAIELDEALHRALDRIETKLKMERAARHVRWVAAKNIHITLKFLGDVEAAQMPAVQNAVVEACAGASPFTLKIEGGGAFPNLQRPNVVWVGVGGEVDVATQLARKIEDACAALGFAREERAFSPHLTIGRVKREVIPSERGLVGEMVTKAHIGPLGECRVERISVMQSDLQPSGSIYTRLAAVELTSQR